MKVQLSLSRRNNASVLFMGLVVTALIGFVLASYLTLVSSSNRSIMRSQYWNSSIPLVEAGIEEALAHLNRNCISNSLAGGEANWTADDWVETASGSWKFRKRKDIGNGHFVVEIDGRTNNAPTIISEGFVNTPLGATAPAPILAAAGVTVQGESYIARKVRAQTILQGIFSKAMLTQGGIDLKGNKLVVDSFDSTDPNAVNGQYSPNIQRENGDIATNSSLTNSISGGNAIVKGDVSTGPEGSVSFGPNGGYTGTISDDMNVDFPDVVVPFTSALEPTKGPVVVDGVTYDWVIDEGKWEIGHLTGNVLVTGDAQLLVNRSISFSGQNVLKIATGASLTLYADVETARFGGQGLLNESGYAKDFTYYGLPRNTSIDISGNAGFVGSIYAPNADLRLSGGGSDNKSVNDFVGAVVTNSVTLNGNFDFHYDENLAETGAGRGYVIVSWNEE